MKSHSRLAPLWALIARVPSLIGLRASRKRPSGVLRCGPRRKAAQGPVSRRRGSTERRSSEPFPTHHLLRIAAVVLVTCVLIGALDTAPAAPLGDTASAGMANSLKGFFARLWNPSADDAEKHGIAYMYDEQGNLLSETGTGGANSTGSTQYIYLPTASGPMPIAAVINGQLHAVHSDHLNTPRRLTNADGRVVWQWAYSAFGDEKPTMAKNRFANPDITPNPGTTGISEVVFNLRNPGQYFDKESELFYNLNRSYSPDQGRYTQGDPIGQGGGWNRFVYVDGNPLSLVDPEGLKGVRPASPGGSAYNRRQWRRHGSEPFEIPRGEGTQSAWEAAAQMPNPDPESGDYQFRCLHWECSANSCTAGKSPVDFMPPAYFKDSPPEGCRCSRTMLGAVFNPPTFTPQSDIPPLVNKYRRSDGQIRRMLDAINR